MAKKEFIVLEKRRFNGKWALPGEKVDLDGPAGRLARALKWVTETTEEAISTPPAVVPTKAAVAQPDVTRAPAQPPAPAPAPVAAAPAPAAADQPATDAVVADKPTSDPAGDVAVGEGAAAKVLGEEASAETAPDVAAEAPAKLPDAPAPAVPPVPPPAATAPRKGARQGK